LGVALAVAFALVGVHRAAQRDVPGALMAGGMAVMSPGMAGIGPMFVNGPWWAAGFAVVAVWPLLGRVWRGGRAGEVCGGPLGHLLGGMAMVYLCALPGMSVGSAPPGTTLTAHAARLTPAAGHHAMAAMSDMDGVTGMADAGLPGSTAPIGAVGIALTLLGWGLACYFLLGTVVALTRRDTGGALTAPRPTALGEALMAFGTVIMLVAMT
jgi:hypothetical protein